jgi:chromosome segregation ATPase
MSEFADVIASPSAPWRGDEQRSAAAEYLGRIVGFLSTPGVKLVEPAVLEQTEIAIEQRLGPKYVDAYYEGMNGLTRDRDELVLEIETLADQKSERIKKQAADKLAKLENRSREADKKLDTLRLKKEEAKAQLDDELKVLDTKLDVLKKEYDSLTEADERLRRLIEQTNFELARIQTDLDLRGANDAALRNPVPILDVHKELIRYRDELAQVRNRAKEVADEGSELLQSRIEAAERHRKNKGTALQQSKSVERWNAAVKKTSEKVKKKASAPVSTHAMRDRLTRPATFFTLDYDAEASRLLQEQGVVTEDKRLEEETQLQADSP